MKTRLLITTLAALGLAVSSSAQTVYEGFDYTGIAPQDELGGDTNGGSGWSGAWSTGSNSYTVTTSGSLSFGSLQTSGNAIIGQNGAVDLVSRDLSSSYGDGDSFWISFLAAADATDPGNRHQLRMRNSSGDDLFNFELLRNSGGIALDGTLLSQDTSDVSLGSTARLLVANISFDSGGTSTAQYWIDPTGLGGASPTGSAYDSGSLTLSSVGTVSNIELFSSDGVSSFDEIRLGDTFASVTPIPEPSSFALLAGVLGLSLVMLRRRRA